MTSQEHSVVYLLYCQTRLVPPCKPRMNDSDHRTSEHSLDILLSMPKNTWAGQGKGRAYSHATTLPISLQPPCGGVGKLADGQVWSVHHASWNLHSCSNGRRLETPWVVTLSMPRSLAEWRGSFDGGRVDERDDFWAALSRDVSRVERSWKSLEMWNEKSLRLCPASPRCLAGFWQIG